MPVEILGEEYFTSFEVSEELGVCRQTLWRWRREKRIPTGRRYRNRQVLFKPSELEEIKLFANHLEPIELGGSGVKQLTLFRGGPHREHHD